MASVRPILDERNPDLGKRVDQRFAEVEAAAREVPPGRRLRALRQGDRAAAPGAVARHRRADQGSKPGARCHRPPVSTAVQRSSSEQSGTDHAPVSRRRKLFGAAGVARRGRRRGGRGCAGRPGVGGQRDSARSCRQPVPFRGERQAGIITAAQDRMHFAPSTSRPTAAPTLVATAEGMDRDGRADDARRGAVPNGAVGRNPYAPPDDTGEALGLPASELTLTIGFGPIVLRQGRQGPVRHRRPAARRAGRPAEVPQRDHRPRQLRRRHLHPGVRQRPAGRRARRAQPGPRRLRHRRGAVFAAGLRPDVVDHARTGHAAKPVRVQGRNQQPQGRGHRRR